MNLQIETKISEIADKARGRYEDAVSAARKGTEKAAGRLSKGKRPVKAISRLGVKVSGVSHRTVNKLWKRQTKLVEDQIDGLASRLKAASAASDLRSLVKDQIDLIPDNASRIRTEAREAFDIVRGAGSEIRDIMKVTVRELRDGKPATRKAPAARKPEVAPVEEADDQAAA